MVVVVVGGGVWNGRRGKGKGDNNKNGVNGLKIAPFCAMNFKCSLYTHGKKLISKFEAE